MHSPLLKIGEPRTRGHRSKQKRQDLFTQRVKDIWNELPNEVVETGTIKSTTEEDLIHGRLLKIVGKGMSQTDSIQLHQDKLNSFFNFNFFNSKDKYQQVCILQSSKMDKLRQMQCRIVLRRTQPMGQPTPGLQILGMAAESQGQAWRWAGSPHSTNPHG